MKPYRFFAFVVMLLTAPRIKAEFLQIDMSIFGMD